MTSRCRRVRLLVAVVSPGTLFLVSGLIGGATAAASGALPSQGSVVGGQLRQVGVVGPPVRAARAFGYTLAATRNTMVVTTVWRSPRRIGAYVYERRPDGSFGPSPAARLTVNFRGASGAQSVAISGDTIVIGDPLADVGQNVGQGAAYVFVRPQGGWRSERQTAVLTAGTAHTHLGQAVGVSGNTIVATSYQTPAQAPAASASMSYVYRRPATGWRSTKPVAELPMSGTSANKAGTSVAINPTTIAVGDPLAGRIDVYTHPSGGWRSMTPTASLTMRSNPRRDQLGQKIAMNGDTIAAATQIRGRHRGYWYSAIAVFTRSAPGWRSERPTAILTARRQSEGNDYGRSLAISSSMILAGGPSGSVDGKETGSAYIFERPSGGWSNAHDSQRLSPTRPRSDSQFGIAVAIAGQNPLIGAPSRNGGHGTAYIFGR